MIRSSGSAGPAGRDDDGAPREGGGPRGCSGSRGYSGSRGIGGAGRAAWVALAAAITLWFVFDRIYPRIPPRVFAAVEACLLAVALMVSAYAFRVDRRAAVAAPLFASILGVAVYSLAAALGLRYTP